MNAEMNESGYQLFIDKPLSRMLKEVASTLFEIIGGSDVFCVKAFLLKEGLSQARLQPPFPIPLN